MTSSREEQSNRAQKAFELFQKAIPEASRVGPVPRWDSLPMTQVEAWIKMVDGVYEQGRVDEQFSTE